MCLSRISGLLNGRIPLSIQAWTERYTPVFSLSYCYSDHPLSNSFGCDYPSQGETTKVILVIIRLLNRHQHKFSRLSFQTTKCHPEPKCVILSAAKDLAPASAFPCYIPHLSSCYSTCHPVIPLVILSAAKDLAPVLA